MKLACLSVPTLAFAAVLSLAPAARAQAAPAPAPTPAPAPEPPPADDSEVEGYSPPHVANYAGGAIPANAHLETRPNWGLVKAGLITLGTTYALSLLYGLGTCGAQMDCRAGSAFLYVPVAGPYFTAAQAPTTGGQALSVFDGVVQSLGAGMLIAGFLMPDKVVVWQDKATAAVVTPVPMPGGAGLVLTVQ